MIPQKLREVLNGENIAAIVTQGEHGAHVVNTWNNYIKLTADERLLIPAAKMNLTEANIKYNNQVLMTLGSRKVEGFYSKGTGFLISGIASFINEGTEFDEMKQRFSWIRTVLEIKPQSITQTL